MSTYSKIFARNLRRARRAQGLTQRELAESLCYSEKAVCKWESGECIPPAEVILMICARLYVSFDELFDQNTSAGYLLGFDGGSIKTEIVLTDLNERVIKSATIGSSALNNLNCAETLTRIDVAIKELTDGIAFRRISAFFGLCTATEAEKDRIHSFLESYNFAHIGIGSDIDNSIAAALGDEDGIAVLQFVNGLCPAHGLFQISFIARHDHGKRCQRNFFRGLCTDLPEDLRVGDDKGRTGSMPDRMVYV